MADRVVFTRPDAARIVNAVRAIEEGSRDEAPLRFGRAFEQVSRRIGSLTLATFSGDWPVASYKTVTISGVTSTPNTASVLNLCAPSAGTAERYVIFGKARNHPDYLVVEIDQGTGVTVSTSTTSTSSTSSFNSANLTLATFSGEWPVSEYKTVTLSGVTSTPNTESVLNLCTPSVGPGEKYVIFGKTRNHPDFLVVEIGQDTSSSCTLTIGSLDLTDLPGYQIGEIQLLGHGEGSSASTCHGSLQWFSITTCATATSSP